MMTTVPLFDLERRTDGSAELVKVRSMTFDQAIPHYLLERLQKMIQGLVVQLTEALHLLKPCIC